MHEFDIKLVPGYWKAALGCQPSSFPCRRTVDALRCPAHPFWRLEQECPESKSLPSIDGPNLHATSKALGFEIDYKRLLEGYRRRGPLLRAFYYTTIAEDQEYSSIRPLIDWLDYNGYTVERPA
ncbi:hypothetical protein ACVIGB_008812 [Bradyrhizobium sp. USDA 4341]